MAIKVVQFTCPHCGSQRLEEVMEEVTVMSRVNSVTVDDEDPNSPADLVYGDQTNEDGEVVCYQCMDCGEELSLKGEMVEDCPSNVATVDCPEKLTLWLVDESARWIDPDAGND